MRLVSELTSKSPRFMTLIKVGISIVLFSSFCIVACLRRPVNDDYLALATLMDKGFFGSIAWYFMHVQGNVLSWFFILIADAPWLRGLNPIFNLLPFIFSFTLMFFSIFGFLKFAFDLKLKSFQNFLSTFLTTSFVLLSLNSLVSPNGISFFLYFPSTVVHVWPWLCFGIALGSIRGKSSVPVKALLVLTGILAGGLGLVEGIIFATTTAMIIFFTLRKSNRVEIPLPNLIAWSTGVFSGIIVQLISPAAFQRASNADSSSVSNVEAVHRCFSLVERFIGHQSSILIQEKLSVQVWLLLLIPISLLLELILRPGLFYFLYFILGVRKLKKWGELDKVSNTTAYKFFNVLLLYAIVLYAFSGILFAYAGRQIIGLQILSFLLLRMKYEKLFNSSVNFLFQKIKFIVLAFVLFITTLLLLLIPSFHRYNSWNDAFKVNLNYINSPRDYKKLVSVPLKFGISQSGLRDFENDSADYLKWMNEIRRLAGE